MKGEGDRWESVHMGSCLLLLPLPSVLLLLFQEKGGPPEAAVEHPLSAAGPPAEVAATPQ